MRSHVVLSTAIGLLLAWAHPSTAQDNVKAVIEKSIQAYGGEQKLARLKALSVKTRGTINLGAEISMATETIYQLPGKLKKVEELELAGNKTTVITVLNGDKGWANTKGQTQELDAKLVKELKEGMNQIRVMNPATLRDKAYQLTSVGEIKLNGRSAVGVKVAASGFRDIRLYFDKESGLIVRMERRMIVAGKDVNMEVTIQEHADHDGLKYPKKAIASIDGKKFLDYETTEVKFLDKVPASVFNKP